MLRRLCVVGIVIGASYGHAVLSAHEMQSPGDGPATSRSTSSVAPRDGAQSKDASTAAQVFVAWRDGTET